MKIVKNISIVIALISGTGAAHAALYDRGSGMIYDSALNITWLQDANFAKTSGYSLSGLMTWDQATTWADILNYAGFTGWRLASAGLIDTTGMSFDGSTDDSFNNTRSEIGHLFDELGNKSRYDVNGILQSGYGVTGTTFFDASENQDISFFNVQNDVYWEDETSKQDPAAAWFFATFVGNQGAASKSYSYAAWAVHDGDIANVPVPATAWLFGSGLIGLGCVTRKHKICLIQIFSLAA